MLSYAVAIPFGRCKIKRKLGAAIIATMSMLGYENVAGAAPPESGKPTPKVGLAAVQFDGEFKPAARSAIVDALTEGFERAGVAVVDADTVAKAAPDVATCQDSACLAQVATKLEASHIAQLTVRVDGRDYELDLTVVDRGGKESKRTNECQICGFGEVATMVGDEAAALAPKLLRADAPALFHIDSNPDGASVRIDEAFVGVTPLDVEVAPGSHLITVQAEGYSTASSEVVGVAGVKERIKLALTALPDAGQAASAQKKARLQTVVGWSLIGVGIGAAGGGGAALALHHREVASKCTGDAIDVNGLCRWRYDTLGIGIPLVAGGAVATITGAVLVGINAKKRKGPDERDVAVSVGPDGFSLSGRF